MMRLPRFYRKNPASEQAICTIASNLREIFVDDNGKVDTKALAESLGGSRVIDDELKFFDTSTFRGFAVTITFSERSFLLPTLRHQSLGRDQILNIYGLAGHLFSDSYEPHVVSMDQAHLGDSVDPIFHHDCVKFLNELVMPEDEFRVDYQRSLRTMKNNGVADPHRSVIASLGSRYGFDIYHSVVSRRAKELGLMQ